MVWKTLQNSQAGAKEVMYGCGERGHADGGHADGWRQAATEEDHLFWCPHKRDVPKLDEEEGLNLSGDYLMESLFILITRPDTKGQACAEISCVSGALPPGSCLGLAQQLLQLVLGKQTMVLHKGWHLRRSLRLIIDCAMDLHVSVQNLEEILLTLQEKEEEEGKE